MSFRRITASESPLEAWDEAPANTPHPGLAGARKGENSGNREAAVEQVAKMGERFERRLDIESKLLIPDLTPSDESVSNGAPIIPMSFSIRPTLLYREKAKYTEEAREAKIQGTVVLNVIFRSDGVMVNPRVIRSLPYGLSLKAVEAASRIKFTPAMKDGAPISVRGSIEFDFNLY